MKQKNSIANEFISFFKIVKKLRKECPWDKKQTHKSIRHGLIEETYEVIESINNNNYDNLKSELGDILLHVVLHSIMAEEKSKFNLTDVIKSSSQKMIRRHPHIFGDVKVRNSNQVKANWEHIKLKEGRESIIDGVPKHMPALLRAKRLQEKASKVGFDWKEKKDVWKKVVEELDELKVALISNNKNKIKDEFGDVLFALVNYSRFIKVNPEFALQKSSDKFSKRFNMVEKEVKKRGKQINNTSFNELDEIWNQIKNVRSNKKNKK